MWEVQGKLAILFVMFVMLSQYVLWFIAIAVIVLGISIYLGYDKSDNW